jgi:hypothetical protein
MAESEPVAMDAQRAEGARAMGTLAAATLMAYSTRA